MQGTACRFEKIPLLLEINVFSIIKRRHEIMILSGSYKECVAFKRAVGITELCFG